jgi:Ca-activated chloride channel family protein
MDAWGNAGALWLLLALIPLAAGLVLWVRARSRATLQFGPGAARLAEDTNLLAAVSRAVLLVAGFALLVLGLSRPQEAGQARPTKTRGIDIVLALDLSKSMLAQDVRPSRLERAKAELGALAERLRGHRFGLVAFAGAAFVQCPLTTDVAAAKLFLRALNPNEMPVPGTSLSRALSTALDLLKDQEGKPSPRGKAIVLLTDGEGHDEDPLVEAKQAKERGIVVHSVGFGTQGGGPVPEYDEKGRWVGWKKDQGREILSTLNTDLLEKIASTTGGKTFHVGPGGAGMEGLTKVLEELSKGELESDVLVEFVDRPEWVVFPAFLIFVGEAVLTDRRRRRANAAQLEATSKEKAHAKAA